MGHIHLHTNATCIDYIPRKCDICIYSHGTSPYTYTGWVRLDSHQSANVYFASIPSANIFLMISSFVVQNCHTLKWVYNFSFFSKNILLKAYFILMMKNIYAFEWCSYQLLWYTLQMACFVQTRIYSIGVNCIRTRACRTDNQSKSIVKYRMGSDFNILASRNGLNHIPFVPKILKIVRGCQTMRCLMNTVRHSIISLLLHRYIRYWHTNWLVCECKVTWCQHVWNHIWKFPIPCWYTDVVFSYT